MQRAARDRWLQRRVPGSARTASTGGVYRKMHLVPFGEYVPLKQLLFFAAPLVEAVSDFHAGRPSALLLPVDGHSVSIAICYEVVYPALVRAVRRRRQRAADDDHQRRVVRADVGAVSAFRAGVDARDRGGPVSGARRQHRHQRHRRSVRARAGAEPASSSRRSSSARRGSCKTSTFYARHGDVFAYASVAAHVPRCSSLAQTACTMSGMPTVDELMRRYEDLSKRAADLRSYL